MEIGTISVFVVTMIGILKILTVKSYIIGVIAGKIVINIEQEESSARVYTNNSNNSKSNSGRNSSIVVSVVIIVIIIM